MVKFLEFWCVDANGIALFHEKEKDVASVDKNLISGFLSAFQSMLKVSQQGEVEAIKFKDSRLIIVTKESPFRLYFIVRISEKEKDKVVRKELEKLSDQFMVDFWEPLTNWEGNIDAFYDFQPKLKPYFDHPIAI